MQYPWPSVCFTIFIIRILKQISKTEIILLNVNRIYDGDNNYQPVKYWYLILKYLSQNEMGLS